MRPVFIIHLACAGSIAWMLPASVFGEGAFPAAALGALGSEEYKERVQAQQDLTTWAQEEPRQAEERLLHEYDSAKDPEVRLRLLETLKEVVISEHQRTDGQGYVGIQMNETIVALPGGNEQRGGVLISVVQPDTPAMKAGLQKNDVVLALNDLKWPAGIGGARESFAAEIRRLKPGDKVTLEVLRGAEVKKIELILGARPMGLDQVEPLLLLPGGLADDPAENLKLLEKRAKDAYFDRWLADKREAAKKP